MWRTSLMFSGALRSLTATIFSGCGPIPTPFTWCPRNSSCVLRISHFSLFNLSPAVRRWSMTLLNITSCSSTVAACTRILSWYISTPLISRNNSFIFRWNISLAQLTPNGRRLNLNRPTGVMKVVNRELSSSRGICQYPDLASKRVKTCDFESLVTDISHAQGRGLNVSDPHRYVPSYHRFSELAQLVLTPRLPLWLVQ